MAEEAEIERMVVRMIGDASSYARMLNEVSTKMNELEKNVKESNTKIEEDTKQSTERSAASYGNMTSVIVNGIKTLGLMKIGKEAVKGFAEEEEATFKLSAALEANGMDAKRLTKEYTDFAGELQKVSVKADDATIKTLQLATSMGLTEDSSKRAAKNAIALSAAFNVPAQAADRLAIGLEQGRIGMLARYIPALRQIKDPAQQVAKAQEILGKSFSVAQAETQTFNGTIKQLKNAVGDSFEAIGAIVVKGLKPIIKIIQSANEWFQSLSDNTKEALVIIGASLVAIGPAIAILGKLGGILKVFTGIPMVLSAIGGGLAFLISPLGIITALVTTFAVTAYKAFGGDLGEAFESAKAGVMSFVETAKGFLHNFRENMTILWNWIAERAQAVWAGVLRIAEAIFPGITDGWNNVAKGFVDNLGEMWTATKSFGSKFIGFFINLGDNLRTFWNWMKNNWQDVLRDVLDIVGLVLTKGVPNVIGVAFNILTRSLMALSGWIVGRFKSLFSFEVLDAILTGLIIIGEKIREWAAAAWETIKNIFSKKPPGDALEQFVEATKSDFKKGEEDLNIFGTIAGIAKDELKGLQNPLKDFKSNVKDSLNFKTDWSMGDLGLPNFNTTLPKEAEDAGKKAGTAFGNNFNKASKAKTSKAGKDAFDAVEFNSAEASRRIASYTASLMMPKGSEGTNAERDTSNLDSIAGGVGELVAINRQQLNKPPVELQETEIA